MAGLSAQTLCNLYTLEQLEEKVLHYTEALEGAVVRSYDKDTSQGRQRVESANMEKIESILQAYLKALECKKGLGGVRISQANFGGHV